MGGKSNNAPSDKAMTAMGGPWQPLQQPYQNAIGNIQRATAQPLQYGPDAYSGFNQNQNDALNRIIAQGNEYRPELRAATNYASNVAAGGQVGQAAGTAMTNYLADKGMGKSAGTDYLGLMANQGLGKSAGTDFVNKISAEGINSPAYAQLQQALDLASKSSGGMEYAQGVAGGKYLNNSPYLNDIIKANTANATNALVPALEGRMAMSGRTGSGAEALGQGQIARNLAEQANETRYADYARERGLQQEAGLALPGMEATEVGTLTGAAQAQNADYYSRIQQQLGAANQAFGQDMDRNRFRMDAANQSFNQDLSRNQLQLGAAGQAYNQRYGDINQALGAGAAAGQNYQNEFFGANQALQAGNQQQANANMLAQQEQDKYRWQQNQSYANIQRRLGAYGQIAGVANPQAAQQQYAAAQGGPSSAQSWLGAGIQGAGLAAQIAAPYASPFLQAAAQSTTQPTTQPMTQNYSAMPFAPPHAQRAGF